MHPLIDQTLRTLVVGEPSTHQGLTLFPLVGPGLDDPGYLTLDEALAQELVEITELSSAGSVPELKVLNRGDVAVLLLDGEELVGAKQNRVLNLTILVPAAQTIVIPVSCVEAGRWSLRSAKFASAPRAQYATGRAQRAQQVTASLRSSGERRSDQGAVWEDIALRSEQLGVESGTSAMSDIYERHTGSIEAYVARFSTPVSGQIGAAFAIGNRVVGLEFFDAPRSLQTLLPKLVRSYALDALDAGTESSELPPNAQVLSLIDAVREAQADSFRAVGEGEDLRLTSDRVSAAGLVARGRVVHFSAFRSESAPVTGSGRVHRRRHVM